METKGLNWDWYVARRVKYYRVVNAVEKLGNG
jgi:hypothetical protein